ncbi:MAG: Gfo/Idh/MocA family oxidoreductase [Tepidisphaeraceae bacterium]
MQSNQRSVSRRGFLKSSAAIAGVAAFSKWTARSYSQISGANSDIRIAVVGCNDCGRSHINQLLRLDGVRIVALCDVDQAVLDSRLAIISAFASTRPSQTPVAQYGDVRKLLESKDLDAITTATPNHWHALITVWACQAGKDVYVEKPVCHNVWEGAQALAASRKYNRIVQAGTQWRSIPQVFEAFEWVKAGNLGKIQVARGLCYKRRASIGKTDGPQPVPATVNYDMWCGPSPNTPLRRKNLHYDWHWVWPTGNGDIGNQGAHNMDLARWALGKSTPAPSVISVGGRFGYIDDGVTPNTLMTVHDYGDSMLIFEVRGLPTNSSAGNRMDKYKGADVGNVIECEGGYVSITAQNFAAFDNTGKQIRQFDGSSVTRDRSHMENFLNAMRSRRREDQNGELAEGFMSSALSHISNISYLLGKQSDPDAIRAQLKSNSAASETFDRFQAHLSANEIDLKLNEATLGAPLSVDPPNLRFVDNEAANAMLTREYREPFVVRDSI